MGGDWINDGLPHFVAIDRKPEKGCEIQTVCCGTSGIMMGLPIVKHEVLEGEKDLNHGVKVMIHLLDKWSPQGRIVCADSYFASVQAAVEMYKLGWQFIGVVKTATTKYPMDFLKSIELPVRGTCSGMIAHHSNDRLEMDLLAFVYCDKD
jgi:Transposase IS4